VKLRLGAHALLELSPAARIEAPAGTVTRVYDEARGLIAGDWPDGATWRAGSWPRPLGLPLDAGVCTWRLVVSAR
jgi:hypothetical protein